MNDFIKAAIICILLFLFHGVCAFVFGAFNVPVTKAFQDAVGILVYAFFYAFWAYYFFSFLYLKSIKKVKSRAGKFGIALMLMMAGYILFRLGDIIDGDFFSRFQLVPLIVFFLTAILMEAIESFMRSRNLGKG